MLNRYFKKNDIYFNDSTKINYNNGAFQNKQNNQNQYPNSTNCCFNGCCPINYQNQQYTNEYNNNNEQHERVSVGPQGPRGWPGPQGPRGLPGARGEIGPIGPQGPRGLIGPAGPQGEIGPAGPQGEIGPAGPQGEIGPVGPQGEIGPVGPQGEIGPAGPQGEIGPAGPQGEIGPVGPQGEIGPAGPQGEIGPAGSIANYADFYAIMPPDNSATVAPGTDVSFPQDGPNTAVSITRTSESSFSLSDIGTYLILFQVSVAEAGQLVLSLNNDELAYTVVGRATGTNQIVGMSIITTTIATSILTVRNPASESTALTITPNAGGTEPVSAHLIIIQLQ